MFDVTSAETSALRGLLRACGAKALAVERTAAAAATVAKERMVELALSVRRNEQPREGKCDREYACVHPILSGRRTGAVAKSSKSTFGRSQTQVNYPKQRQDGSSPYLPGVLRPLRFRPIALLDG